MELVLRRKGIVAIAMVLLTPTLLWAQTEKEKLVVAEIKVSEGVGTDNPMGMKKTMDAFKGALRISLNKKFAPVSRDLKPLLEESAVSGDNFKLTPAKFVLITTVTDFEDSSSTNHTEAGAVLSRDITLSGTAEIQKLNGEIFDSAPFSVTKRDGMVIPPGGYRGGKFGEKLLGLAASEAAKQIADYVTTKASDSSAAPKQPAPAEQPAPIENNKGK